MDKGKRSKVLLLALSFLALLPAVSASTGISPLDTVVRMLADFVNIPAFQDEFVQSALIKFGVFMIMFSLGNMVFKKRLGWDKRTAGTVSFVIAFAGGFFMPDEYAILTGGILSSIVASLIALFLIGGLIFLGVRLKGSAMMHFFGLIVLFIAFYLIIIVKDALGLPPVGESIPEASAFVIGLDYLVKKWQYKT